MKESSIHETVVRDIIGVAQELKDMDEVKAVKNRTSGASSARSIAAKSDALTLVFPVMADKGLSYGAAALISKAMERKCVTMLHMLFSAACITDAKDGMDYLSRFHTNLRVSGAVTVDDFIDVLDSVVEENALITEASKYDEYEKIKNEVKSSLNFYLEDACINDEDSLMDFTVYNNIYSEGGIEVVSEKLTIHRDKDGNIQPIKIDLTPVSNPNNPNPGPAYVPGYVNTTMMSTIHAANRKQAVEQDILDSLTKSLYNGTNTQPILDLMKDKGFSDKTILALSKSINDISNKYNSQKLMIDSMRNDLQKQLMDLNARNAEAQQKYNDDMLGLNKDKFNYQRTQDEKLLKREEERIQREIEKADREKMKLSADLEKSIADIAKTYLDMSKVQADMAKGALMDYDIKKANELMPTMMNINFVTVDSESKYPISNSMMIGIKCKLYAVDTQDIINRLKVKNTSKNLALNLIKASTREVSFFKDFLFAIDRAKIDALSQSRRGSSHKLWKVLERRALKSKIKRNLSLKNDATPISTLVISQETAEYLKRVEYVDVENPRVIRPIMDAYNFMGFVIVDESLEIAKFVFDTNDDIYEVLTFDNLEREQKDNTKKVINLLSKMR